MHEKRSESHVVCSAVDVNAWLHATPSVDDARPSHCCQCGAASRPVGEALVLHGHGVRARQVREPPAFGEPAVVVGIVVRRYQCRLCSAVMTVVPRGVLPGLLYSACAIGWALALFGFSSKPMCKVRELVGSARTTGADATGWPALRRWIARAASLWPTEREMPALFGWRQRAARVAAFLASHASPCPTIELAAFVGAAHAR